MRYPVIAGYTIEAEIDKGGFGCVYRATQHSMNRSVAIKILDSSFADERQRENFEHECKVMGPLSDHPHIVTVFTPEITSAGQPAIVMELYAGTYRGRDLTIAEVVDVGAKISDALQAIHDHGIIHRDIKPHNIFISGRGQPAIGDFGISKLADTRTSPGRVGFTIDYTPPEFFEDGGTAAAGDIYSLGATLYHMAAGQVPFPYDGPPADKYRVMVPRIITAPPPSLSAKRSDAPEALDRLLRRCMAKNPSDRPPTAADVASEFKRIQKLVGLPEHSPVLSQRSAQSPEDISVDERGGTVVRKEVETGGVAVVRDREGADDASAPSASAFSRRRWTTLAISGVAVCALAAVAVAAAVGGEPEDDSSPTTTATRTDASIGSGDFEVLSPPTGLTVTRTDMGEYKIAWASDQADVGFQIHHLESNENRYTNEKVYTWTFESDPGKACFSVATVNESRTKVSQSSPEPECATG